MAWFGTPAKWWERVLAVVASVLVFAIVGFVVRLISGPLPLLPIGDFLRTVALWSGSFAGVAALLAILFPKLMLCIVYPFSLLEVDSNAS